MRTQDSPYSNVHQLAAAFFPNTALAIPHHPGDNAHPLDWSAFAPAFAPPVKTFQVRGPNAQTLTVYLTVIGRHPSLHQSNQDWAHPLRMAAGHIAVHALRQQRAT